MIIIRGSEFCRVWSNKFQHPEYLSVGCPLALPLIIGIACAGSQVDLLSVLFGLIIGKMLNLDSTSNRSRQCCVIHA